VLRGEALTLVLVVDAGRGRRIAVDPDGEATVLADLAGVAVALTRLPDPEAWRRSR
jgi:hypothetical protein